MNEIDWWRKNHQMLCPVLNFVVINWHENYKHIACADLVNVNIALNLHSYEENYSLILFWCSLNHKIPGSYLLSHYNCTCASCTI